MESYTKLNETRVRLLKRLQKGDKLVMNLYWDIGTSWHNCYYHLNILKKLNLVKATKEKDTTLWGLTDEGHKALQRYE